MTTSSGVDGHLGKSGSRRFLPSMTLADIYMVIIFLMVFLGIGAIFQIYSSIESLNQLKQLNFNQIIVWQEISKRIEFFIGTRENRVESDVLIRRVQSDMAELIEKSEEYEREFNAILDEMATGMELFALSDASRSELKALSVEPEMLLRANEVRDAPVALVRTNFDYWPTTTTNGVQSQRFTRPLHDRELLMTTLREDELKVLYLQSIIVVGLMILGILLIWLGFLRPTVRKLSDTRADMQFILDNAPGFICSYSPEGDLHSANRAYLEMVGVPSLEGLKGRHISEFVDAETWQKLKGQLTRAAAGEPARLDLEVEDDKSERVLLASYRPKLAPDGSVSAVVAMIMDISDRHKAERALRLSEENLRITLHSIDDAVIATDNDGKIVRMNPRACNLTGWEESAAIDRDLREVLRIVHSSTREVLADPFKQILAREQIIDRGRKMVLLSKAGQEYIISESGAPICNLEGETIGAVIVFRDMTEEYLLNERLMQSEKLKSIGQLAGGIAHDFNNLLAGIQGGVNLLVHFQPNPKSEETMDLSEKVERMIQRGAGLTEQLTQFAKLKEISYQLVNLAPLLIDSIEMVKNTSDRRITFEFDDQSHNSTVYGSDSTLHTIFLNIILNSVDAISEEGTIGVVLENEWSDPAGLDDESGETGDHPREMIVIRFSDTGCGIAPENLPRIFDPFLHDQGVREGHRARPFGGLRNGAGP